MDYIFYLDMDNFITNPDTLNFLIRTKLPLVSPMLTSGHYSNFWGAMNEEGYYKRHDDYMPIVKREKKGCFKVPMIHSTYLIDLKKVFPGKTNVNIRKDSGDKHVIKNFLTFDPENFPSYNLTLDDIIIFAKSAQASKVDMHICNNETFGHLLEPLKSNAKLDDIKLYMHELKMDILNSEPAGLLASRFVPQPKLPTKNTMGFDKVYMINLEKRPERRERMLNCFDELGLDVTLINGIDGNKLNDSFLKTQNITMLGNYKDPYHKRALTLGEIGCFLSHYQIWREVLARDYRKVLVFEDDIRFEKDFRTKVEALMKEPERLKMNWDLIYFGRKRLVPPEREKYIKDSDILVWPDYSYWTLSYALSHTGAQKLSHCSTSSKPINPLGSVPKDDSLCPLNKMVPVDEYLPIMFDMHPEEDWKKHFPNRDLVAFSAYPLIVYPTHYTGDDLYFSDTEDSPVIANMTAVPHLFNHRYDTNGHKNREEL
ncbi:procollagen galactosyltransferase 1-like [Gordionus sp. m RMFG-2023]|uniref:procollagen galactosyltransferase 1-like n=1 Tax=Gordionus sp. m RMFG-2023 TaxID=3053472 RepID=UPI0031FCF42C